MSACLIVITINVSVHAFCLCIQTWQFFESGFSSHLPTDMLIGALVSLNVPLCEWMLVHTWTVPVSHLDLRLIALLPKPNEWTIHVKANVLVMYDVCTIIHLMAHTALIHSKPDANVSEPEQRCTAFHCSQCTLFTILLPVLWNKNLQKNLTY